MATLPNVSIDTVPAESPTQTDPFPALDPINTFDLVGPTAANRSPNALKQRDFTLRDRVNLLVANMNDISTGDAVDSAVLFLPRDGTNPMTGDLDMGGNKITNQGLLLATPTSTPDDYVQVSAGTYQKADGKGQVVYAGGSVQITTSVGGGQTRYDLVHLNDSGTLAVTQGVVGSPGVVPDFLDDELTIAVVKVDETGAIIVNAADITDVRPFLAADQNARTLQTYPIADSAPSSGDGLIWSGSEWAPAGIETGWRLKAEISGESALSAVTVGESGCDYTTIGGAITYIDALTRSKTRQCAIYIFEKRNGQDWAVSSAITIPSWTHLIGMGKPTLKTSVATGDAITLSEGASLENVCVENSATGWSYQIALSADDVTIRNVDVRHEHASVNAGYALGVKSGNRIRIENFRLFPQAATPTNGCRGIEFGVTANVTDVQITNCRLQGDQLLLIGVANTITRLLAVNLVLIATSTTATYALYQFGVGSLGFLADSSFTNVYGECVAGPANGVTIVPSGAQRILLTNINLKVTSSDDMILIQAFDCILRGFRIVNGRAIFTDSRISAGSISYGYNDADPAISLGDECGVVNTEIDRGSQNAPGIGPFGTATKCVVSGCSVKNTGTSASIKGAANCNDWHVTNCVVDVATDPNTASGWVYSTTFTSHEIVV